MVDVFLLSLREVEVGGSEIQCRHQPTGTWGYMRPCPNQGEQQQNEKQNPPRPPKMKE